MFGSNFRDFVSQEQSQSSKILKKSDSRDSGNASQEGGSEVSDDESQGISVIPYAKGINLENAILTNFPDGCDRSFIVESKDEDSYDIVPKNLTFTEIKNVLNQAVKEDIYEELDKIVQNIEGYEGRSITLDHVSLRSFCEQQLSLDLQNNQHIYSSILSRYNFDLENYECAYAVKELVLLAIAANDKLVEKYQNTLFAEENLNLLPLLVGNQKYIEVFIEKFHGIDGIYDKIKNQAIQFDESNKIGFFSVIALRKEQELLKTVLVEYVLRDLEYILKTSDPNPVYGVLETASLIKNEKFITIVLNAFERYINEPTKKDLLKGSFATLLETAISQEHVSIVEYLCRERIEKKGSIIQEIYKEAFADEKIIEQIKNQVLKNIDSAGNGRKEKKQKIYDLILQAASCTGSTDFIIKVLDLIKNDPKFLGDTDRRTFLQNSLVTILDNVIREKHSSIIQNVYTNFVLKLAENSGVEFLTIQQRYQNACHTSISVDNNVAGQFNEETNGDDSNLEQNEFEITDIQEEQGSSVLGSNRTEIAGFSQEKLLEIINFVKIGYYVSDCNLNNKKFSELEKRSYRVPAKLKEEGYKIIQFYNMRDSGQLYRHAGYVFIKDKEITIVYRGSRNLFDYMKDAEMILTSSDGLLPEGGKIHSGFYSLFKDSWDSVYEILKGHANDQKLEIKDFKINLTGHSMGGAIATIAALYLSVREGAEDLHVATFASSRVFDSAAAEVYKERLGKKTIRVVNQSDFIPSLPLGSMGYKHVSEQLRISSSSSLYAHSLDMYRNLIINIEPDKFKSDNSVSIYYYPSYFVTALYNVFTSPSYLIPNTHSNGDEQYFKQVKNKHKDASLSEMMKYSGSSNEQKAVIHEDSEPGEDGFITFHTLRNAIGEKNLLTISPTFNPNGDTKIFSKFYKKDATGLSVEFIADNISVIAYERLNAGISQVVVPTSTGSSVSLNFNDISNANQEGLQKIAKALMHLFTRGEFNSRTVNAITNFPTSNQKSKNTDSQQPQGNIMSTAEQETKAAASSQSVSREDNNQLNTKESKNQQPQRNVVGKVENIMYNKKASKEAIGNNCEEDKMHSSDQNIKTIEEKLSDAIFSLDYEEVRSLVEQAKQENNAADAEQILNKALEDANKTEVQKKDKKSLGKTKEIRRFLQEELKNIAAAESLVGDDVETTASDQAVPVVETERSKSDSLSLSSEGDDFSKLESNKSDDFARTSSSSPSFEVVDNEAEVSKVVESEATIDNPVIGFESVDASLLGATEEHIPEGQSSLGSTYAANARLASDDEDNHDVNSDQEQDIQSIRGFENEDFNAAIFIGNNGEEQQSAEPVEQIANENIQPKPVANEQNGNESDRNVVLQNMKGTTIATWVFAITGILAVAAAPAAYFALGTSLLVAGAVAGIGAFCIVAAIAIHYNKSPSDSLAKPSAENVIVNNPAVGTS